MQLYYDKLEKKITRGKIKEVEQRKRFLSKLKPKIKKLCIVKKYVNMETLLVVILKVEKLFRELGEAPYEPFKEDQEKIMNEGNTTMEKYY